MSCLKLSAGLIIITTLLNVSMFLYVFQHNDSPSFDTAQTNAHKLQEIDDSKLLQQEQLDMIKNFNKFQERSIEIEEEHLSQLKDLHHSNADLLDELKRVNSINIKRALQLSQKENRRDREKRDEPSTECRGQESRVYEAWAGMEYYFGFKTSVGSDSKETSIVKKLKKKSIDIPREDGRKLGYAEFYKKYVKQEKPVVITHYFERMCKTNWTLPVISKHCFGKKAQLKKYNPDAARWGNLEIAEEITVDEFIKKVQSGTSKNEYLFDFSLNNECPTILKDFSVPRYFAPDYLQRIPSELFHDPVKNFKNTWPSLFIGTGDTRSGLHIDAIQSHFWMGQIAGHKRWAVVPRNSVPFLYPDPNSKTFLIGSLFDVDVTRYPLVTKAQLYETVLSPGEILYVPGGAAHEVMNLDTIIAISMNYIDEYNVQRSAEQIKEKHPKVADLLLNSDSFVHKVPSKQEDLSWEKYKSWPRNWEVYDLS